MKKLCSIAILSFSVFSFGLVTPLSAGIFDFIIGGTNGAVIEKHGTRVAWSIDGPNDNDAVIEKHGTRVSRGPDVGDDAVIEKHGTRVSRRVENTPVRGIITKDDIRTER